jgi:hypothetical protein
MQYTDDRYHLRVEINAKEYNLPADELTRMQQSLEPLGEAVRDFPQADLAITVVRHPRLDVYHVEARLRLPGKTLFSGDQDAYLDSAFQRCVRKLTRRAEAYHDNPDRDAVEAAERLATLDREVVAPEEPEAGLVGEAVRAGDYKTFRTILSGYEEWLRKRVGRWVQRYPDAEAKVGRELRIGDLVEEVYLNAFEQLGKKPADVPFRDWLDGLIDPSLKLLLRHPFEEAQNASLARTVRELPAERT